MKRLLCTYESVATRQWHVKTASQLLLLFFVLTMSVLKGHSQSVTGKVMDADGKPLAGATVKVKGGIQAVVTNAEGEFPILAKAWDKLLISYFNYKE